MQLPLAIFMLFGGLGGYVTIQSNGVGAGGFSFNIGNEVFVNKSRT
jgi:hypothetical protein